MSQSTAAVSWSEALFIIGQDLDWRGIKTLVVRCEGNLYVVEAGYQSPPAATPLTLHYTPDDIRHLDHEIGERNGHNSAVKDFLSLGRVLWAIGIYVMDRTARLLRISNADSTEGMPVVGIEYESVHGKRVVETLNGSAIYELCVSAYKLEKASRIDDIDHFRFSALSKSD